MLRAVALTTLLAAAGPATVTDLGALPGGASSTVFAMAGDFAAGTSSSADAFQRAFLRDAGGMHALGGSEDHTQSAAADVNGAGVVVGSSSSENLVESRPVRWVDGTPQDLGDLGGDTGGALGVNDGGVVVGWSSTASGASHAFRWNAGRMEDLDAILPKPPGATVEEAVRVDDGGRIVGRLALADGQRVGFLWDGSALHQIALSPGEAVEVRDFDERVVVGTSSGGSGGSRAFTWRDGAATELAPPPGDGCAAANAVSGAGDVAGWSSLCGRAPSRAVVWRDSLPIDVQVLLSPGDGIITRALFAADERGRVGGYGELPSVGSHAIVLDLSTQQTRVAGPDAIATAIEAYRRLAPGPRFGVVLAPVDAPADVALASYLAARRGYPLLLTGRGALDPRVASALEDFPMLGSTVYLVGGTAVLGRDIEGDVAELRLQPRRLAGTDRYGTSAAVTSEVGGSSSVFAVDGHDTTTAISAVPLAAHRRASIVLVDPNHPAPPGARLLTSGDRELLAKELTARPVAPAVARFSRISDGAVAAVLAARAGSPVRWVERVEAGAVFVVGGTAVLPGQAS